MTDDTQRRDRRQEPRRTILRAGALASAGSLLGLSASASAQDDQNQNQIDDPQTTQDELDALLYQDEYRPGAVFRVTSPALEDAPTLDDQGAVQDRQVRVIEYFNTQEQAYLFPPSDAQVEVGDLYALGDTAEWANQDQPGTDLVEVSFAPVDQEDFEFDLEDGDFFDILDGGGEAAVRSQDFSAGALFRIVSGPQGWVPEDVADSGWFTDYQTHHAEYLGTDDEFLIFVQGDAEVEEGQLYVLRDDFEILSPEGTLIGAEFDPVDGDSLTVDDEFL